MPEKIALKARCYIPNDVKNPKLQLRDIPSNLEIRFLHERPDGNARERHFINRLLQLLEDYETLTSGESYIKLSGNCELKQSEPQSHFLIHWDNEFTYKLVLNYSSKLDQSISSETKNFRTDCRNMIPDFRHMSLACKLDGQEITPAKCNICRKYDPRYIQYPTVITGIRTTTCEPVYSFTPGAPVAVRPNDSNKTYFGIYLGEIPMALGASLNPANHVLTNKAFKNPAFWVFDLERIIFGAEAHWKKITTPDDMSAITDDDIERQLCNKLLHDLEEHQQP